MLTHTCAKCKAVKPAEEFPPAKSANSGRASYCRDCAREYYRLYMRKKRASGGVLVKVKLAKSLIGGLEELAEKYSCTTDELATKVVKAFVEKHAPPVKRLVMVKPDTTGG